MNNLAEQQIEDAIEKEGISRVEWVYRTLKQSILNNELYPGYQALEPEIAKNLGVSRTPVREALIRLENERLIELIPRRGMRVVPLVPSDMREIYQVLTSLEVTAVELLARQRPLRSHLFELEQAINDMDQQLAADHREGWAEADDRLGDCLPHLVLVTDIERHCDRTRAGCRQRRDDLLHLGGRADALRGQVIGPVQVDDRMRVVDEVDP